MTGMIIRQMSQSGFGVEEYTQEERRAFIYQAEVLLCGAPPENQIDLPADTEHFFADGIYSRKLLLRKGCYLTGKIHRYDDILIVAHGDTTFFTEHETRRLVGPCLTVVKAGSKPLLYANEDTIFYNAHPNPTNEHDLAKLEDMLIIQNEAGKEPGVLT